MTAPESTSVSPEKAPAPAPSWSEGLAVYLQPRVLIVLLLGFSSGLPLALSGSTLLVWMRESGVDLGTIGLFALVGTPYTLKFLWAPLVDALHVPFFTRAFGRRRGCFRGVGCDIGRDHVVDTGHRGRCISCRKPARERTGRRHGVLCRGLP